MSGGREDRVAWSITSDDVGDTYYLVRRGVEPHDAMTMVASGGQETDQLQRWMSDRSEARRALDYYLRNSELSPEQEWERFDPGTYQQLLAAPKAP